MSLSIRSAKILLACGFLACSASSCVGLPLRAATVPDMPLPDEPVFTSPSRSPWLGDILELPVVDELADAATLDEGEPEIFTMAEPSSPQGPEVMAIPAIAQLLGLALPEPPLPIPPAIPYVALPFLPEPDLPPGLASPSPSVAALAPKPGASPAATPPVTAPSPIATPPAPAKAAPASTPTTSPVAPPATPKTPIAPAFPATAPIVVPPAPSTRRADALVSPLPALPTSPRLIEAELGAKVEIPFDGSAWTYLGDMTSQIGVSYEGKRFEGADAVFILSGARVGDYLLRFQRQDPLRAIMFEEYIHLSIKPKGWVPPVPAAPAASSLPLAGVSPTPAAQAVSAQAVAAQAPSSAPGSSPAAATVPSPITGSAPAAASTVPAALPQAAAVPATPGSTPLPAASPLPLDESPEALILKARNELSAGKVPSAIATLERYRSLYPRGSDEMLFLFGLCYEQDTPFRNIRTAYDFYCKLRDDYPQSPFWDQAVERADYIKRHYFEIR